MEFFAETDYGTPMVADNVSGSRWCKWKQALPEAEMIATWTEYVYDT